MSEREQEIERRTSRALEAIRSDIDFSTNEYGAILFLKHHLKEVDEGFWIKHTGKAQPSLEEVVDIIVLKRTWGGPDGLEHCDFTLPDEITNYVICVQFNEDGSIYYINMES